MGLCVWVLDYKADCPQHILWSSTGKLSMMNKTVAKFCKIQSRMDYEFNSMFHFNCVQLKPVGL